MAEETLNQTKLNWNPLGLDRVIDNYSTRPGASVSFILAWVALIALSIYSVLMLIPESWVYNSVEELNVISFFLLYPPLIIGALLLFWFGFEWGFIPVFLSSFVIAFSAQMPVQWALLFAFSFILGLGIYALAYYCVPAGIHLRDLKSIAFFTVVSLVAAMASSLGSFVWSLEQGLSAAMTVKIWNGWWTGAFFQAVLIVGPLLAIFSPHVVRFREKMVQTPAQREVTLGWIYGSISSVVVVVSLFIIGGRILGNRSIAEAVLMSDVNVAERVIQATESYQLIFWISIGLILTVGLTGIYLVSSWNRNLQEEVSRQTAELQEKKEELEASVKERDLLLNEIHGRVKNNLGIILALFELQLKRAGDESLADTLRGSKSRIRAISLIHELMSQSGEFQMVNIKSYMIKLSNRLDQDYRLRSDGSEINLHANNLQLNLEKAVPVSMIANEIMNRVYEKVHDSPYQGAVSVDLYTDREQLFLVVRENGQFAPGLFEWNNKTDLSMKLVRSLTKQIEGEIIIDNQKNSIAVIFNLEEIPVEDEVLSHES